MDDNLMAESDGWMGLGECGWGGTKYFDVRFLGFFFDYWWGYIIFALPSHSDYVGCGFDYCRFDCVGRRAALGTAAVRQAQVRSYPHRRQQSPQPARDLLR